MKLRKLLAGLVIFSSVGLIACSKESIEEPQQVRSAAANNGSPSITIKDGAFTPASYYVVPGATVTWTNRGTMAHSVVAENGSFNSGLIQPGASWSRVFTETGPHEYRCGVHPDEQGVIHVVVK